VYTPEKVYHISLYNDHYVMYSILTESYDQELLNKPSYMVLLSLVLKVLPEQSKCSKHLTGFLRHYKGSTIFILEANPVQLDGSTVVIYKVDYKLMHKCLGHPSKNVLTNAPNCIKGFFKDLEVPSTSPVCPSCA